MYFRRTMLVLLAACLLASSAYSQSSVTVPPQTRPGDRSFYLGQPVSHPEAISGVWEAPDGNGGAVGIHLQLTTAVSGDADPPVWIPQSWQHLDIGVFQRRGVELAFGEENNFADDTRGGSVKLENGHLELHFVSPASDAPSVDLDLTRQADGCWYGRFHRGDFDSTATLCRPTPGPDVSLSPLVGTWSENSSLGSACIHIVQAGPAAFTGWSDLLAIPGYIVFSRNTPKPHELFQNYGILAKVHLAGDGGISLEFGAYNALCCSHKFVGRLSADGSTLEGDFPAGPNQAAHGAVLTKISGDSCVDASMIPKHLPAPCPPSKSSDQTAR